jgi:hypothetical protein
MKGKLDIFKSFIDNDRHFLTNPIFRCDEDRENRETKKTDKLKKTFFFLSQVREDWKYVAMVLDRLFLWIFTVAVLVRKSNLLSMIESQPSFLQSSFCYI